MFEVKPMGDINRGNRAIRLSECGGEQGEACKTTTAGGGGGRGGWLNGWEGGRDEAEVEEGKMK